MSEMVKLIDEYILKCKDNIKLFDEYRSKNQSYFLLEKNSGDLIETILNTFEIYNFDEVLAYIKKELIFS